MTSNVVSSGKDSSFLYSPSKVQQYIETSKKIGEKFRKSCWQGENVYKCAKNIRKMKRYPIIRILSYLRDIESKEKNYEESIK